MYGMIEFQVFIQRAEDRVYLAVYAVTCFDKWMKFELRNWLIANVRCIIIYISIEKLGRKKNCLHFLKPKNFALMHFINYCLNVLWINITTYC